MSLQGTSKSIFGFDPRTIGSCSLWLDASDQRTVELTGSGNVSIWKDKSSNLYVFSNDNTSGNLGPTYTSNTNGKKVLTFTATSANDSNGQSLYNTTAVLNTVSTIFFVHNPTTTSEIGFGDTSVIFSGDTGGNSYFFIAPASIEEGEDAAHYDYFSTTVGALGDSNNNVANQYNLISLVIGTNVQNSLRNGSINGVKSSENPPNVTTSITIGGMVDPEVNLGYANLLFFSGNLAEIIVYDSELTSAERQAVEGYLGWKWGLETFSTKIFPSNHPYYSIQPFSRYFNPIDVPGCVLWLDGADPRSMFQDSGGTTPVTAPGQTVQCWKDKSGRELNVSNGTTGPEYTATEGTNTARGLSFASVDDGLSNATGYDSTVGANLFAVWSSANESSRQRIASVQYLDGDKGGYLDTTIVEAHYTSSIGKSQDNPVSYTQNETYLYSVTTDTQPTLLYGVNGSNDTIWTSNLTGVYSNTALTVGTGGGYGFNGIIKEVLYYDTLMTLTQRQKIEGYLCKKWGITLSPEAHPFYNFPPLSPIQFLPNSILGCELWLDAADPSSITGTTTVTQWDDKSGNTRHLGVGSGNTSYANRAVTFASSYMFVDSAVDLTSFTCFIVFRSSSAFNQVIFGAHPSGEDVNSDTTSDAFNLRTDGNTIAQFFGRNTGSQFVNITGLTLNIDRTMFSFTSGLTVINARVNGNSVAGATGLPSRTSTALGFAIGASFIGTGSYFQAVENASIHEIIVYNVALTTTQRQQIEGYLAWKWGLQSQLPFTHPYYKFMPSQLAVSPLVISPSGLITTVGEGSIVLTVGTQIIIECWGGGGGSMGEDNTSGASSGAAYAKTTISLTGNYILYYNVGAGGTGAQSSGGAGGSTWARIDVNAAPTVDTEGALAVGGSGAPVSSPNNSTQIANSIGQTIYKGGAGGAAGPENGGGGSASSLGNGNDGSSGQGAAGGAAGTGGGAGGAGGGTGNSGGDGISNVEGGGGGGGSYNNKGGQGGVPGGAGGMGWDEGGSPPGISVNTNPHSYGGDGGRGQIRYTIT